ncbi:MAG: exodeoxyribonuclease III [Anaerovoracaceae bacterium]
MNLISWNVNGLRACVNKGFLDFLEKESSDFLCLQEIKMQKDQADFELTYERKIEGEEKTLLGESYLRTPYYQIWNSAEKKGYSGTLILSKEEPLSYSFGLPNHDARNTGSKGKEAETDDPEGRLITAEFEKFILMNVYIPNSKNELAGLPYRMLWEDDFRKYLSDLKNKSKKPVIICGDMNVAHNEIDLTNPKTNTKNAGFTIEERSKMSKLRAAGFVDSFRYLYPDKKEVYTWWSYRTNARGRNVGWRIDYFIVSDQHKDIIKDSKILPEVMGSDHCPVQLILMK